MFSNLSITVFNGKVHRSVLLHLWWIENKKFARFPLIKIESFQASLIIVWNFELYMLPCTLVFFFARSAVIEYRRGRLGKYFSTLGDDSISAVVQPAPIDDETLENEANAKVISIYDSSSSFVRCWSRNRRNHSSAWFKVFKRQCSKFKVMLMVLHQHWNVLKSEFMHLLFAHVLV